MALDTAALTLLPFPQQWSAASRTLRLRFLCVPSITPLEPLAAGIPSFADAALGFEARLIDRLDHAPRAADVSLTRALVLQDPPLQKRALFGALADLVTIDPAPAPAPPPARPRYRKAVTASYRALTGRRELSGYLADADAFDCALHDAYDSQPNKPVELGASLRWGALLALALRQRRLAEALGLMGEAVLELDDGEFPARGGWLYVALAAGSDGAGVPGIALSYAARIPPLAQDRSLYAAVLFPLDKPNVVLDDIERDAQRYDHGHARMVHGAQIGDDGEPTADGDQPRASDSGDAIRLAWDDEQVAEWLNRQADPDTLAPMGTAGFRVDVRRAGAVEWHSLQRLRSVEDLSIGALQIGPYEGEGTVEVVPTRIAPALPSEYWMPRYFATWRGRSLVLPDDDLARLHRGPAGADVAGAYKPLLLGRTRRFEPVDDRAVPLTYGEDYEFRVRLVDLSCGGPDVEAPLPPQAAPPSRDERCTATIAFRRRRRPGPVQVKQQPTRDEKTLVVLRPRLGHPDILYTRGAPTFEALSQEFLALPEAERTRGLGRPDPDALALEIALEVRALDVDGDPWQRLYTTQRAFPVAAEEPLELVVAFEDMPTLAGFAPMPPDAGALPLPTARDLRLTLRAIGRADPAYFADEASRQGLPVSVTLHLHAANEADWAATAPEVRSFFFRLPPRDGSVPRPAERLANELGLAHQDLMLAGRAGRRTVFGCSAALRHTLSPEASALTLSSDADATQQWITALRFTLDRDWSWRGLGPSGIAVHRSVQRGDAAPGVREHVGTIRLPYAIARDAAQGAAPGDARAVQRQSCEVLFFDALDPKPRPPEFPAELTLRYELTPQFEGGDPAPALPLPTLTLPVTTPPSQVPQIVSAGIALTPYQAATDYSSSEPRRRRLWFEFAQPPLDPGDAYFVRVLALAPDPLLIADAQVIPELVPEPPLPLDPEWVRIVDVGQSRDDNGAGAMQSLPRGEDADAVYGLVPLPAGLSEAAPELFGLFTYEIRVGHADARWCTAQGRYGPALRVAGVQHPPPQLACQAARMPEGVRVRAAFATPVHDGRLLRPTPPKTRLWALLYARVRRADGDAWQNLLLLRAALEAPAPPPVFAVVHVPPQPPVLLGEGAFALADVRRSLSLAGLDADTPLTVMVVEVHREPTFEEPLGRELGHARLLRVSALVSVPHAC